MPKLSANTYQIKAQRDGTTTIEFRDGSGRSSEISFPSIAIMGLAHALRQAAQSVPIPIGRHGSTGLRKLGGPPLPRLDETGLSGTTSQGSSFELAIAADFESILTRYDLRDPAQPGGGTTFEFSMSVADAEQFLASLTKAVALAKTKPSSPGTKH